MMYTTAEERSGYCLVWHCYATWVQNKSTETFYRIVAPMVAPAGIVLLCLGDRRGDYPSGRMFVFHRVFHCEFFLDGAPLDRRANGVSCVLGSRRCIA